MKIAKEEIDSLIKVSNKEVIEGILDNYLGLKRSFTALIIIT
jgi:hypothetical protein